MKKELAVVGVAAACVACCALPLGLLASTIAAAAGLAGFTWGWQIGLAALVLAVVASLVVWRRRVRRQRCAAANAAACGCSSACATP